MTDAELIAMVRAAAAMLNAEYVEWSGNESDFICARAALALVEPVYSTCPGAGAWRRVTL